jgi:tetratricopeptide (TPR) repeat protein
MNSCSICLKKPYCSSDCQKGDWKFHKSICKILKKLSHQLQPYHEVVRVIKEMREEISTKIKQKILRVLGHLLSYADHQFGDRILGKSYRERGNGERIDNWSVEIGTLIPIYSDFISIYEYDESLSMMARDNLVFPYYEKLLELLRPWSAYLDSNRTSQIDSLDEGQINFTLLYFTQTEGKLGAIYFRRNEFNLVEDYFQRALTYARLYEGEEETKTGLLYSAFIGLYELHMNQGNYDEALNFVEEAYNCVAVTYNPVHPEVQEAAGALIECLICMEDFEHAETFAQLTLESLKDPGNGLDQQSEAVARGYYDLGHVIFQQKGDLVKAEKLVRESLRIRSRLHGGDHADVGVSSSLLAHILQAQGKLGIETKELYERSLAISVNNFGSDGFNTAASNGNLGTFYHRQAEESQSAGIKKEHLSQSVFKFKEVLRIYTKIFGPDHPDTVKASSQLSIVTHELSKA